MVFCTFLYVSATVQSWAPLMTNTVLQLALNTTVCVQHSLALHSCIIKPQLTGISDFASSWQVYA